MKYADNAYQTAGLSANAYMETVTSFSASLLQSLGGDTEAAAKLADQAIIDMSDNANKMGTDMAMIQNAYNGFAKQNFTMLDNLKLGYGGTQEEMKRLLADAQAISGIEYDISSYADIVQAIHVIQTEMGITGTTAKEASATIGGSVNAMKAAWQNLTVGFADENADIDQLMDNFLASVGTVADNVLPVVERVLGNIFQTVKDNGPEMLDKALELFGQIAMGALRSIPGIIATIPDIVSSLAA
jgi:phage-related protein